VINDFALSTWNLSGSFLQFENERVSELWRSCMDKVLKTSEKRNTLVFWVGYENWCGRTSCKEEKIDKNLESWKIYAGYTIPTIIQFMTIETPELIFTWNGHALGHENLSFYSVNISSKNAFMPVMTFKRIYFFGFYDYLIFAVKKNGNILYSFEDTK